jgi:hypothetical protein
VVSAFYSGTTDFGASTSFAPSQQSSTIQVLPDTDPPAVSVSAPFPPAGQGGYFNINDLADAQGAITVTVTASDTSGEVVDLQCVDDGVPVPVINQTGANPRIGQLDVSTNGTHVVVCTATDSASNTGNNGGPNAVTVNLDLTPPTLTVPLQPLVVDATSPAGALVSAYPVTAADSDSGDVPSVSCDPSTPALFAIGDGSVSCQATDRAGNVSPEQGLTVHVAGPGEQLDDLVAAVGDVGPGLSLVDKAVNARTYLDQAQTAAACGELVAFANEVTAQAGKKIPGPEADQLVGDAQRIMAVIGC